MFSSPPRHGAAIVVEVLSNPQLYAEWRVRTCIPALTSHAHATVCMHHLTSHARLFCTKLWLLRRLGDDLGMRCISLTHLWVRMQEELAGMAGRIIRMRRELFQALQDVGAPGSWTPVMDAIGMFAMLGLSKVGSIDKLPSH